MRAPTNALIVLLVVAAGVLSLFSTPAPVRVVAGVLLVLVLPGLALTRALLPRETGATLVVLSVALSMSVAILGGLILHFTPSGLTRTSWVGFLVALTAVATLVAQGRVPGPSDRPLEVRRKIHVSITDVVLLALALMVGVTAMAAARTPVSARGVEGYTALWMLPGPSRLVKVGAHSSELDSTEYRLDVLVGKTRLSSYRFTLATGERWTTSLRLQPGWRGYVRGLLFKETEPRRIYRRVRLLVGTERVGTRS